jgi:urocanate hydratase
MSTGKATPWRKLTNIQKVMQRPLNNHKALQWMLCNYGCPVGVFRTRQKAIEFAMRSGRDMEHHELRRVLVFEQGVGALRRGSRT